MVEIIIFLVIILIFAVLPSLWYLKRKNKVKMDANVKPNIIIIILTSLILIFNTYFAYLIGQGSISYVFGYVFFIPIVLVLIFGDHWRMRWNTLFYSSFVIFLSIVGNLLTIISKVNDLP